MSKSDCIAARAPAYIGMRYRLGEEGAYVVGPEQTKAVDIDCSGLIYALMRDCNVLLNGRPFPRETADDYWHRAKQISKPERIGDMCWFPKTGRKTHVALYIGNNTVIEAGNHGPGNKYPGSGYVGTCTIAQMNARGAVWGRIEGLDIYKEVDMTPEETRKMIQDMVPAIAREAANEAVRKVLAEQTEVVWSDTVNRDQTYLVQQGIISKPRSSSRLASISYVDSLVARVLRKLSGGKDS
jgi:hypothetical protein